MERKRIALFGLFGIPNLGNECTLQAVVQNLRRLQPAAELYAITYDVRDTTTRHGLPAVQIEEPYLLSPRAVGGGPLRRLHRLLTQRLPGEVRGFWRAVRALKGTDLLVMTGTGMLTDSGGTWLGYPYDIFKWALAARLRGSKVRFVGVGVGPLYASLSRRLVRMALGLSDYRSFRDEFSRSRIAGYGFDSRADPVYPDLAFSMPDAVLRFPQSGNGTRPSVGLGVVNVFDHRESHGQSREVLYEAHLEKMCVFVSWLTHRGYGVRILMGDATYDGAMSQEFLKRLQARGLDPGGGVIVAEHITSVEHLLSEIAATDFVISPRFHNVILGLLLGKPAIAISYDPKSDVLMESFGLGSYCQPLAGLDVHKMIEQFMQLESTREAVTNRIATVVAKNRDLLEQQYTCLVQDL